ncbi:MAG: hypothetical protein GY928_19370 [Colwellia sp.]|nr:hypothetical protein [Colwellia sp.]
MKIMENESNQILINGKRLFTLITKLNPKLQKNNYIHQYHHQKINFYLQ